MNDKTRAAIQQALEYLRDNQHYIADNERHAYVMEYNAFVERLEALADHVPDATKMIEQPAQQEPYCWMSPEGTIYQASDEDVLKGSIPMYLGKPPAQQQEPVGYFSVNNYGRWEENEGTYGQPLYDHPQAREPLTDEEIDDIWNYYCDEMGDASINDSYEIARAIEAKLKEKNT